MARWLPLLFLLVPRPAPAQEPADWVWWEAETPKATNFPDRNPFAPGDEKAAAVLSGGKWIGASDPGKILFLEYDVAVPKDGEYQFFVRKFWLHGPFKWRFDEEPWRECGKNIALLDEVSLAKFVGANWVRLGAVTLRAGTHPLRIELLETKGAAAFDCFLLTQRPFTARGKMKPGEKYNVAPEGWFPFEPDADPFGPAALDLRFLNESAAGDGGAIQAKGDVFVHEKTGAPVRFWAVNTGHDILNQDPASMARYARRLAKVGVNMIRLHGPVWREDDVTKADEEKLAKIHLLVASLKKEGIYTFLSSYFPLWLQPKAVPGLEGFNGDKKTFSVPFFNERFQEIQKGWWKAVLGPKNPHTGLSLGEDPALAVMEIQNEDGIFFWTFSPYQNVPAPQMEILEKRFGAWLSAKYATLEAAFAAWGKGKIKGDDPGAGRAGFMPLWEVFNKRDARARDTAEFLATLQRHYYDGMAAYLKKDLGFRGCVVGSNWVTADARTLGPLDKWSNAGCDFLDRHGYFGGPHEGERASYSISAGDRYADASALLFEGGRKGEPNFNLPLMDLRYNGKPSTISEICWTPPNRYRADMPLLCAAWGALQGTDAFFFFATGDVDWAQRLTKFPVALPTSMGQFPAAALLYRRGLVKTADDVVRAEVKLSDLFALKGIPVSAPQNLDEFRKKDIPAGQALETPDLGSIDPLAFLAGRVEVNVTEAGGTSRAVDLSPFIDRKRKVVKSATGELTWDYGRGLATVDAPAAQGATGFLAKAGPIELGDVTIDSPMEYGSVLLVAMDGQPIRSSRKLLLQVMSEDNNNGWSAPGEGMRAVADAGGPPIVVRKFSGRVSLKRADADTLKAKALTFNGYEDASSRPVGAREIPLLPSTLYYVLEP
jgi:predicted outer membrane repeat protein